MTLTLAELLPWVNAGLWHGFVVFVRVATLVSLLPAFGEQSVPVRIKLAIAFAFTLVVAPAVTPIALPPLAGEVIWVIVAEVLAGLIIGLGIRLFVLALQTAGSIAAQSTSLSQILGGAVADPLPALGYTLIIGGLALAVMAGLHVKAAELVILSYDLLPIGRLPDGSVISEWGLAQVRHAFELAFTLAAPFVIVSVIYNLTLGVINKAMPQLMVAFVGAPVITFAGVFLLFLAGPLILSTWLSALDHYMANPFGGSQMSGSEQDTDKSHEATPQKLLEARKKGELAKSNDLLTAAGYAGLLAAFLLAGASGIADLGTVLMVMLDQAHSLAPLFATDGISPAMGGMLTDVSVALTPFFLFPAVGVLLAVFAQRAMVFAPSKLEPKLSRISPIANAKNKFGRGGLFEFAKSFVKLCIYSAILAGFLILRMPQMLASVQTNSFLALSLMAELCVAFLLIVVLISGSIGGVDAIWQHFEHLRKNRMSRKEIMDETKNSEGDPYLKQERRQRAMAISQNQMMGEVSGADVIIVNPTHYAVALKWSRAAGTAPTCVAKGVDEIAKAIRKVGAEAGVPIHSDPPSARALFATTELGAEISPEHYAAVAAAIRFAEAMRLRAKAAV